MDNHEEKTDRFFRDRLLIYEEAPENEVWVKISEKLANAKKKSLAYFFLRVAAGMTLLCSLSAGYYMMQRHIENAHRVSAGIPAAVHKSINGVTAQNDHSEKSAVQKSGIASPSHENKTTAGEITPEKEVLMVNPDVKNIPAFNEPDNSYGIAYLKSKPALLQSPLPNQVSHRRMSQAELAEQTALLMVENTPTPDELEKISLNRWNIGTEAAPLYSYRSIQSDYPSSDVINNVNKSDHGLVAFAGGVRAGYSAGRRLSIESGIYYSRYGQEKNNVKVLSPPEYMAAGAVKTTYLSIPNSIGTIYANHPSEIEYDEILYSNTLGVPDFNKYTGFPALNSSTLVSSEGDLKITQYFDYLELPLALRYKIIDKKLNFSIVGGMVTNFLVNNGVRLKSNGNSENFGKTRDINKVNYQASIGLGLAYPIIDRLAISLEPRFRYYLNPIDEVLNVHPYSFGLFAGLSYSL